MPQLVLPPEPKRQHLCTSIAKERVSMPQCRGRQKRTKMLKPKQKWPKQRVIQEPANTRAEKRLDVDRQRKQERKRKGGIRSAYAAPLYATQGTQTVSEIRKSTVRWVYTSTYLYLNMLEAIVPAAKNLLCTTHLPNNKSVNAMQ